MSGHNKWSKIHRKKEIEDQRRGTEFTKLGKAIALAAKKGGSGDPNTNFALRLHLERAKQANMPKETIQRAIDRGLGKEGEGELEELTLEGYGPQGVAVVVEVVTDNRNRAVSEIKNMFEKSGGSLAEPGAVLYQFERRGVVSFEGTLSEEAFLRVVDAGAEDLEQEEGSGVVICDPGAVPAVVAALVELGVAGIDASTMYRANVEVASPESVGGFLEKLQGQDDVQEVYSNVAT